MNTQEPSTRSGEMLVRQYFDALRTGRIVDALDVFATDAVVRDADGSVHRGIRAIAASHARTRESIQVDVVELMREGDRIAALVELRAQVGGRPIRYRDTFQIHRQRVTSLTVTAERPRVASRGPRPQPRLTRPEA